MKIKKSCFVGLLFSTIFSMSVFCNDNFNIHFETETGFLYGNISEYVFENINKNTNHMDSQLDWDILTVPYIEESVSVTVLNHFFASFNGRFGFPGNSGNMQDYDWLNSFYWPTEDPTKLTNYSIHDNYLEQYYLLSGTLGFSLSFQQFIYSAYASYEYEFVSFTGSNGYSTYKENNWQEKKFTGKVIAYKQECNSVFFGLQAKANVTNHLNFDYNIQFSPGLTFINALDYHFINRVLNGDIIGGTAYLDEMSNCNHIKSDISLVYNFNKHHQVGVNCGVQLILLSKGSDSNRKLNLKGEYVEHSKWSPPLPGILGGTSRTLWNFGLTYTLSF